MERLGYLEWGKFSLDNHILILTFPFYLCESSKKMLKEVWKKMKNIFILGFFGSKKSGDLWILLPCVSCMFFSCFINVGVCVGTILCFLKMGCIRVNTLIVGLETCYKKINEVFVH